MKNTMICIVLLSSLTTVGQGRRFLKEKIRDWNECKNVAMTLTGGDVALHGRNGWAASGAPKSMTDKLSELNDRNELVDDLVLTESGSWLILWGNNGVSSYGCPRALDYKIKDWNKEGEVIYSITFNDNDDWIMISKDKFVASDKAIMEWLREGENVHGELWAAHLTNTGLVAVYEKGYKFLGDVPSNLKKALEETRLNVFRIKFLSDGSYFMADLKGEFECYL